MKNVRVDLVQNGYEIRIGADLLSKTGVWLHEAGCSGKVVVITDTTVGELYTRALHHALTDAGFSVSVLEVPAGEEQKTLDSAGNLYQRLVEVYAERTTPVLALGGGVVGDLAGFVAATYMRGVPLVQLPTTLLAQVDSSIGGKTAVDHGRLKNVIGAFYQPKMVVADVGTLQTLPEAELSNGMAEVIKHAAILDGDLFGYLEENMDRARALDTNVLEEIVYRNVAIKASVVAQDERESGLRAILNFGHTIGHAVEAVSGFGLKHGEAVAVGMAVEAEISRRRGGLDAESVSRLKSVITRAGLPAAVPDIDIARVIDAMRHDKKVADGKIRFVLLNAIGDAYIADDVDPALVEEVLSAHG
jgi:3-dehydroquinate synthase